MVKNSVALVSLKYFTRLNRFEDVSKNPTVVAQLGNLVLRRFLINTLSRYPLTYLPIPLDNYVIKSPGSYIH